MQSLVTLLISGVLLATVAHAQQYWCSDNGKEGTTAMPAFVANDAGNGWELPLGSTSITSASSCVGNVDGFADTCTTPYEGGGETSARAASGALTASIAATTLKTYCYLPRGECNLKLCVKADYEENLADCANFNSGTWEDYAGGFTDGVATVSTQDVAAAGLTDQRNGCGTATTGGVGCYQIQVGYVSACGSCESPTVIYTGSYGYSSICTDDDLQITSNITTMDIDLGALSQDRVTSPSSSTYSNEFTANTISAEFGVNDFQVPYLISGTWAAGTSRHTGAISVSGTYHLVIKPADAGTARLIAACNAMEEGSRPDEWSGSNTCSNAEFGDCFQITEGQGSYECGGSATTDTQAPMTWDSTTDANNPQYHAGINIDCQTVGDDNCCHQITLVVNEITTGSCSAQPYNGGRRLGDSSGRANRYLQEDEDRKLFGMSYSMAVQTSGDDSSEFVGGADPSRVSDSGGSAGWLPAVAVGGLLLLGGAVVAVTRRPSLLRGAFHGPTKVLPNEDN
jgi:hypothetical protein